MEAHYSVVADPRQNIVRITLSGFFDPAQVGSFKAMLSAAYRQLRCQPNQHVTLCDVSGMKIQTQDVVAAFTKVVHDPRTQSRKLAFIIGSSLARLQTQRTAERRNVRYFKDVKDAEAWLFAQEDSIAA